MKALRSDQRGSMTAVFAILATFMTGLTIFVVGIGDAILIRQELQGAADAGALAAAEVYARGMNRVATLNRVYNGATSTMWELKPRAATAPPRCRVQVCGAQPRNGRLVVVCNWVPSSHSCCQGRYHVPNLCTQAISRAKPIAKNARDAIDQVLDRIPAVAQRAAQRAAGATLQRQDMAKFLWRPPSKLTAYRDYASLVLGQSDIHRRQMQDPAGDTSGQTAIVWPIIQGGYKVGGGGQWGAPRSYGPHSGQDIGHANKRAPILAVTEGTVVRAANTGSGYGNRVEIDHGTFVTSYSHLSAIHVSAGDVVTAGQSIGRMGSSGGNYASHVHFEVIMGGVKQNPNPLLDGGRTQQVGEVPDTRDFSGMPVALAQQCRNNSVTRLCGYRVLGRDPYTGETLRNGAEPFQLRFFAVLEDLPQLMIARSGVAATAFAPALPKQELMEAAEQHGRVAFAQAEFYSMEPDGSVPPRPLTAAHWHSRLTRFRMPPPAVTTNPEDSNIEAACRAGSGPDRACQGLEPLVNRWGRRALH